jgi:ABC-type glycerol-3-phosphate transport system substrate-binding protein
VGEERVGVTDYVTSMRWARALVLVTFSVATCGACREPRDAAGKLEHTTTDAIRILGRSAPPLVALERVAHEQQGESGIRFEITRRETIEEVLAELGSPTRVLGSYDLAIVPHRFLGQLVEQGVVAPIDTHLKSRPAAERRLIEGESDFFPGWWRQTAWYHGQPYGYPLAARSMSLWIRGDFWDELDADAFQRDYGATASPRTWNTFERMVEFQHRREDGRYGTVVVGAPDESLWYLWLQYAYSFGAQLLATRNPDEYGDIVVNSPAAQRATELYLRMLRRSPPGAAGFSMEDALRAFQDGRIAAAVMWHDLAPRLDDRRESKVPMRTDYQPVPSADGTAVALLEADLLLLLASSAQPREALHAMEWAVSHDVQRALTLSGGFSARPSVYEDHAVKNHLLQHKWSYPRLVSAVAPVPSIPETNRIVTLMSAELSKAAAGQRSPQATLDRIAVQLQELLAGKATLRFPPR